jgi:hypothetical protein
MERNIIWIYKNYADLISFLDSYRFKSKNYSNFKTLLLSLNDIVRIFNNRYSCKLSEVADKELMRELKELFQLK